MTPGKAWTETGKPLSEDTVVPFVTGDGRVANVIHVVRPSIGTSSRSRPTRALYFSSMAPGSGPTFSGRPST